MKKIIEIPSRFTMQLSDLIQEELKKAFESGWNAGWSACEHGSGIIANDYLKWKEGGK